jgi:cell division protein FtsQ
MSISTPVRSSTKVVASQVEPRIVDRRQTVQLLARRRRHRMQIALVAVVLLVAAAVGLALSPVFAVQKIAVTGQSRLEESALVSSSGIAIGDHLVAVDLSAARSALMKMPWVASAHVERKWPHTLSFKITEQQPAAVVRAGQDLVLVSSTGRILQREEKVGAGQLLLELDGSMQLAQGTPPGTTSSQSDEGLIGTSVSSEVSQAIGVLEAMDESLRSEIGSARLSRVGALSLELTDGTEVLFGPPEDVAAKLLAVESVLNQVVRECMKTLDVREPTRAAVSRGPGCAGISPASSSKGKSGSSSSAGTQSSSAGAQSSSAGEESSSTGTKGSSAGAQSANQSASSSASVGDSEN